MIWPTVFSEILRLCSSPDAALVSATIALLFAQGLLCDESQEIVIVVLSQDNVHHQQRSALFLEHVSKQDNSIVLYELYKKWPADVLPGAWTILPIFYDLLYAHPNLSWLMICEEETRINIQGLRQQLARYEPFKPYFLGEGLVDAEPTIIHHYAHHDDPSSFLYPDPAAGFLLSVELIKRVQTRLNDGKLKHEFSIDVKHEIAMYIWNNGRGTGLADVPWLCNTPMDKKPCVTYYRQPPNCWDHKVTKDDVYVGVKTHSGNHNTRVTVVKRTWGKDLQNIEYCSDAYDKRIPTVKLHTRNTQQGHCAKTLEILQRAHLEPTWADKKWVIIADDDTIFNVNRLLTLLSCYDHKDALVIGERYGYGLTTGHGYDYPTGGAGMIFSRQAVFMLIESGECQCATDDAPDDMTLGMCLLRLSIPVIHSQLLHQARPVDYSAAYLAHQTPVSFHRHWNIDPYQVYSEWLLAGSPAPPIEDPKEEL